MIKTEENLMKKEQQKIKQLTVYFLNDWSIDDNIDRLKRKLEKEGNVVYCESRIPEGDIITVILNYLPTGY